MLRTTILFIVSVCIVCFACFAEATDTLSKLARCRTEHPTWSEKICLNVVQGKVEKGMTEEQVIASWGSPQKKFKFDAGHSYWHYPVKQYTPGDKIDKIILHMENGKVIELRSHIKRD
jgi:hypothetical protein